MKRKSLLFLLLFALIAPWTANAQSLWSEDFEGGSMPTGWTTDGPGTWSIGSGDYSTSTGAGQGTYNALITHSTTGNVTKLITPEIDLSSVTTANLSFMHIQRSWAGDIDQLKVYYRASSSDAWTQLVAYTSAVASWTTEEDIILPNISSTYQLAFEHTDNYGYGVGLDDIKITLPASCPKPSGLTCTGTTSSTAELTWVEGGSETEWVLEYGTAADFTGATSVNVSSKPYTITGLATTTTYYAHVKANCREESDWTNAITFTTKQVALAVGDGWSDDFEGNVNWVMVNGGNNAWVIGTAVNNGGEKAMYVSNDGGTTNAYTNSSTNMVYATKLMTFETGQYIFTYDWQAYGESNYDYIRAWLAPATATFTANQLPDGSTSMYYYTSTTPEGWYSLDGGGKLNLVSTWQEGQTAIVDVTAGDYYVVFMWGNDSSGGTNPPAAIDNFEITKEACAAPSAFAATDVTAHTATLGWTSDGTAWQVAYTNNATADPDDLTAIDVTTNSYELTGLTGETTYYAYVRTDCDGTYSAWISTNFTTGVACPAPTALTVTLTSGNGSVATLSWTENGTATEWDLEYGLDATFGEFRVVNVANTPSTTLEELTPETKYYARVKTYCGGEDGYSTYSNVVTFTPTDALSITVNDGTTTNGYVPVYGTWVDNFSKSQFIIPAADLADMVGMGIQKMTFYSSNANVSWGAAQFEVYVAEVENTVFEDATLFDWTRMTKVRNAGALSIVDNKMVVELTSPYQYMGGNLMIGILETTSGTWSGCSWYGVTQTTNTAIGGYETSKALALYTFLPKTTFNYEEMPNCFATNLTIEPAAESAALTWTSENENFDIWYREIVTGTVYDFEEGMGDWTTIDADGDGFDWQLASVLMAGYSIPSHGEGEDCVSSQSYDSDAGALTPDNYLVSPQITLGGSITFWAEAQDADYPSEHFGVAVSTTGNTDAADFTTIAEWTMTAKSGSKAGNGNYMTRSGNRASGTWYQFTVDLSAYSGQGYVAIRHFNCSDMFYLNVDDISIVEPDQMIPWTEKTSATNSYTITGLTPETQYEVQVRANCGNDEYSTWLYDTFTTLPLCEAPTSASIETGTDYITLSWVSEAEAFDIMLDDEIIEEGYQGYTYTFENLDPGTTYVVAVRTNCRENGTSDWVGGQFMTDCEAFDLPYEYNFDDMLTSNTPDIDCWTLYSGNDENEIGYYYEDDTQSGIMVGFGSTYPIQDGEDYGQILISPALNTEAPVTVSFDYRPNRYDEENHIESFAVGYMTSMEEFDVEFVDFVNATNPDEFTTYTTTLPAGTKYVVVYYTGENPYTLNGGYYSYLFVDNFVFEEGVEGQTIELTAGWNYVSTYIDLNEVDGITMLEEALGDYGLSIVTFDDQAEYVGDGLWIGLEDYEMTNAEMVMVEVSEDCTITLAGPTVDPSTVEITINPEWTYIGYPFAEAMTVEEAMSAFEAEFGDGIASFEGLTEYLGEWMGDFDMLVPGQGYMYYSYADDVKTLVYNTGAEKARRVVRKPVNLRAVSPISIKQVEK